MEHVWQFTQVHATFSIGIMLQRDIMHKWFPNSWVINSNLYLGGRYTRPVNGLEIKALFFFVCVQVYIMIIDIVCKPHPHSLHEHMHPMYHMVYSTTFLIHTYIHTYIYTHTAICFCVYNMKHEIWFTFYHLFVSLE